MKNIILIVITIIFVMAILVSCGNTQNSSEPLTDTSGTTESVIITVQETETTGQTTSEIPFTVPATVSPTKSTIIRPTNPPVNSTLQSKTTPPLPPPKPNNDPYSEPYDRAKIISDMRAYAESKGMVWNDNLRKDNCGWNAPIQANEFPNMAGETLKSACFWLIDSTIERALGGNCVGGGFKVFIEDNPYRTPKIPNDIAVYFFYG